MADDTRTDAQQHTQHELQELAASGRLEDAGGTLEQAVERAGTDGVANAARLAKLTGEEPALPKRHAAASVRMREGAATCGGLQCLSEPRSTGFGSATCPLSQVGHCAARGSRAHHRPDQLADCSLRILSQPANLAGNPPSERFGA
eukprot:COSAG06_NODE_17551_length_934_cov_2.566467_1_plen_146_part_00